MLGTPHRSAIAVAPPSGRAHVPLAALGMRRLSFVRIVLCADGVACQAVGMGHRLPTTRPVSLATAAALATSGVPTVVRSQRGPAAGNRTEGQVAGMYVCHCRAVTDRAVRAAMDGGARSPAEVSLRCGAGTGCGGCLPALRTLLAELGLCGEGDRAVVGDHHAA